MVKVLAYCAKDQQMDTQWKQWGGTGTPQCIDHIWDFPLPYKDFITLNYTTTAKFEKACDQPLLISVK